MMAYTDRVCVTTRDIEYKIEKNRADYFVIPE